MAKRWNPKIDVVGVLHSLKKPEELEGFKKLKKYIEANVKKDDIVALELSKEELMFIELLLEFFKNPMEFKIPQVSELKRISRNSAKRIVRALKDLKLQAVTKHTSEPKKLLHPHELFCLELVRVLKSKKAKVMPMVRSSHSRWAVRFLQRFRASNDKRECLEILYGYTVFPLKEKGIVECILKSIEKGTRPKAMIVGAAHAEALANMLVQHGINAKAVMIASLTPKERKRARTFREFYKKKQIIRRLKRLIIRRLLAKVRRTPKRPLP